MQAPCNYRVKNEAEESGFTNQQAMFLGELWNEVALDARDRAVETINREYAIRQKHFNEYVKKVLVVTLWTTAALLVGKVFL